MRQRLPERVQLQGEQMIQAGHPGLTFTKQSFLGSLPHPFKGGVVHKHQIQTVAPGKPGKLCERLRLSK